MRRNVSENVLDGYKCSKMFDSKQQRASGCTKCESGLVPPNIPGHLH